MLSRVTLAVSIVGFYAAMFVIAINLFGNGSLLVILGCALVMFALAELTFARSRSENRPMPGETGKVSKLNATATHEDASA